MGIVIHRLRGKMESTWLPEVRAILDTWITYDVTLAEFREAVLIKGVHFANACGGRAWIVDSSLADGAFSQQIHDFIETDVFPAIKSVGVQYFFTINSMLSLRAQLTVSTYAAKAAPAGLTQVEVKSVADAVAFLKEPSHRR